MSNKIFALTIAAAVGALPIANFFNQGPDEPVYQPKKSIVFEQAIGQFDIAIQYNKLLKGDPVTGEIRTKDIMKARQQVQQRTGDQKAAVGLLWNFIGPTNVGGRTRSVVVDRNNPDFLVTGGVAGGVYFSTNRGESWSPKIGGDNHLIGAIAQTADGSYYIGTGPALDDWSGSSSPTSTIADNILGNGIYRIKSVYSEYEHVVDVNESAEFTSFNRIAQMVAHPTNPDILFVATFSGGLKKTKNASAAKPTWENASGITTTRVVDVDISPDGNTVLAVTGSGFGGGAQVFRSTDGGDNFERVLLLDGGVRAECAMSPTDGNYAYISVTNTESGGCLHGIWQSSDGGETWDAIARGNTAGGTTNTFDPFANPGTNCQGHYDNAIAVYPDDPGKILVGGVQLWRGQQQPGSDPPLFGWTQVATTNGGPLTGAGVYVHADKHRIVIPDANTVYIGSDGGIGKSTDGGNVWTQNNLGNHTSQFYSLAIAPQTTPTDIAMGGTQDNGTLLVGFQIQNFTNDPKEAFQVRGGDGFDCDISTVSPVSFATSQNGSLSRYDAQSLSGGSDFFDAELEDICENECGEFYTAIEYWDNPNAEVTFDSVYFYFTQAIVSGTDTIRNLNSGDSVIYLSATGGYPIKGAVPVSMSIGDSVLMPDRVQHKFAFANIASATGVGVYLTRDAGRLSATSPDWSKVLGTESYPDNFSNGERAFQMQFTKDGNHLFVGTTGGALYRISNLNYAYDSLTTDIRSSFCVLTCTEIADVSGVITGIATDPNDAENLIVTIGGYRSSSVFRITNAVSAGSGGANPIAINGNPNNGGLPEIPVFDAEIDISDNDVVLIGTQFGVWATDNAFSGSPNSIEWTEENMGMPRIPTYEIKQQTRAMALDANTGLEAPALNYKAYYIGTHAGGFFKTESLVGIDDLDGEEEAEFKTQLKLFPNPSKDNTFLAFELPSTIQTLVRIFDLKGQMIQETNYGNIAPGKQRVQLNTNGLAPGTYIVSLQAGDINEVTKLVKIQ